MYPLSAADCGYTEGEQIAVDELRFTAWHTPGHTLAAWCCCAASICSAAIRCLQAASAAQTLRAATAEDGRSLRKFAPLPFPPETRMLPGHGEFSTFGRRLATNFYIRNCTAATH